MVYGYNEKESDCMRDRFKFVFPEREMRGREGSAFGGCRAYVMPYDMLCLRCGYSEFNDGGSVKGGDGMCDAGAAGPFREFSENVTKRRNTAAHILDAPVREHRSTERIHPLRTGTAPSYHFRSSFSGTLTIILPHGRPRSAEDIISGDTENFRKYRKTPKTTKTTKPKYCKNRSDMP